MTRLLNNRSLPLLGSGRTKALAATLALVCLVAQCLAQGSMAIRFEGHMSPLGGYRESGMILYSTAGPEVPTLVHSGWSGCPSNGTHYLGSGRVDLLTFRFDTLSTIAASWPLRKGEIAR